jgi:hypothetical protein
MLNKGWWGFDLDATIAFYDTWRDGAIGSPVKPMIRRMHHYLKQGRPIRIVTARVSPERGASEVLLEESRIRRFLVEQFGDAGLTIPITNAKDSQMIAFFDDRAEQVIPNKGILVREELRRAVEALQQIAMMSPDTRTSLYAQQALENLDAWSLNLCVRARQRGTH